MAAITNHLQRDALMHGTDRARVHQQGEIGMAVNVDEARAHVQPGCINLSDAGTIDAANRYDASLLHGNVRRDTGIAETIEHCPVSDYQLWRHLFLIPEC
jgi:hypothetical protein